MTRRITGRSGSTDGKPSGPIAWVALLFIAALAPIADTRAEPADSSLLRERDRIVFLGATFAERLGLFGSFETALTVQFPGRDLTFRNLGWSADEVSLRPRPRDFGDIHQHLEGQRADVIFLFYGSNESFGGRAGLESFQTGLQALIESLQGHRYNGRTAPRLLLVSPIPQEKVPGAPDPEFRNQQIRLYSRAMEKVASETGVRYLDIFEPMAQWIQASNPEKLTINGVHLGEAGDWAATQTLLGALGFPHAEPGRGHLERLSHDMSDDALAALRHEINAKNRLFFDQWRAVNGYYIYGGRKKPFGVVSFPPEMEQYETLIRERERKIVEMNRRIAASR